MRWAAGLAFFLVATSPFGEARADDDACVAAYDSSQRLRRDGKLSDTRAELVICAQEECPAPVRKQCTTWLREVNEALPTVVFGARDANGNDVSETRVLEGDRVVAKRIDGREVSLDPGEHVFVFVFPGGQRVERRVLVRQAEKNRLLDVVEPSPKAKPTVTKPRAKPKAVPSEKHGPPVAAIVLGSLGAVALGTFALLALDARSDIEDLEDDCAPECDQSDVDRAHRKALIADISLGVSVVSFGAAGWLWLDHSSASTTTAKGSFGKAPRFTIQGKF